MGVARLPKPAEEVDVDDSGTSTTRQRHAQIAEPTLSHTQKTKRADTAASRTREPCTAAAAAVHVRDLLEPNPPTQITAGATARGRHDAEDADAGAGAANPAYAGFLKRQAQNQTNDVRLKHNIALQQE